jgi:hypothetical protein
MPNAILETSATGSALDTIQTINSAVSITASAWGSTIPTTFTAAGQTLTLPAIALGDIGKSITVLNAGTNAFALAIASGAITSVIGLTIAPGSTFVIKAVSTASAIVTSTNAAQNASPEYGENVAAMSATNSTTTYVDIINSNFTLPTAGVWEVTYNLSSQQTGLGLTFFRLADSAGVAVPRSVGISANENPGTFDTGTVTQTVRITTNGSTVYKAQLGGNNTALKNISTSNNNNITWKKLSGALPITGQTLDYLKVKRITSAQVLTVNTDVLFNSTPSGNIPYNSATGVASLKANKLHKIKARLVGRNDGTGTTGRFIIYDIFTAANAPLPATANHTQGVQFLATSVNNEGGGGDATAYFMPTVDTDIKVRLTAVDGNNWTLDTERSCLEIEQLGTSVSIKTTLAKVQGTFSGALSGSNLLLAGIFDPTGAWNNTTGLFTAPRTADYLIAGGIAYQSGNSYTNGYEILYLGGASNARIAWGYHGVYTGYWGMSGAITVRLTAGQMIGINCTKTNLIQTGVDSNISISELPNDFVN